MAGMFALCRSSLCGVPELRGDPGMLCCSEVQGEAEGRGRIDKGNKNEKDVKSLSNLQFVSVTIYLSLHPSIAPLQVGNIKKETVALWYKDGREIKADEHLTFTEGVLTLEIAQVGERKMYIYTYIYIYIYICIYIERYLYKLSIM